MVKKRRIKKLLTKQIKQTERLGRQSEETRKKIEKKIQQRGQQ